MVLGDVLGWLSSWENKGGLVLVLTFLTCIKYFDHFLIYIRFKEVILIKLISYWLGDDVNILRLHSKRERL